MDVILEQGGLSCYWVSSGDDVVAWLRQAAMDAERWTTLRSDLVTGGYTETDEPLPGTIQGARSGDAFPALINSNGVTYYVGYSDLLSSVLSLQ